jgi:inhibitor of cysteine peptidase
MRKHKKKRKEEKIMKALYNTNVVGTKERLSALINPNYQEPYQTRGVSSERTNALSYKSVDVLMKELVLMARESMETIVGTNEQVRGVRESDIIKTDGYKIFYTPTGSNKMHIIRIEGNKSLTLESTFKCDFDVKEMYLANSKIILVGSKNNEGMLQVIDKDSHDILHTVKTDASFEAHRVYNDSIYIVGKKVYRKRMEDLRPVFSINDDQGHVDYSDLFYFDEEEKNIVTLLFTLNLRNLETTSKGYLGSFFDAIHMNQDSLFIAEKSYNPQNVFVYASRILKFDVKENGSLDYKGVGLIKGHLLDQYSIDEFEGTLRVVTTEQNGGWGNVVNRIATLKEDTDRDLLVINGLVDTNIGKKGEQVKSVRFDENLVYITTFLRTDPVYTINISDMNKPIFKTEIIEDGFNAYMHPWGNENLIGIGFPFINGSESGIKISAYEVSGNGIGKTKPLSSLIQNDNNSIAIKDPKRFLISTKNGFIGMPTAKGYMMFNVDFNSKKVITEKLTVKHSGTNVDGAVYVDEVLYTVSNKQIEGHDVKTGKLVDRISIVKKF